MPSPTPITDIRHPNYRLGVDDWEKWRLIEVGGSQFVNRYLSLYSDRETTTEFDRRKAMAFCPNFAKSAVHDIKNAIFQRIIDTIRTGGSKSYQDAVSGLNLGVDLRNSDMHSFIGLNVLPELLAMGKVGVYVDNPADTITTLSEKSRLKHPYLYTYAVEDILSWEYNLPDNPSEFVRLLLCDHITLKDETTGLPAQTTERYRLIWIEPSDNCVHIKFYNNKSEQTDEIVLNLHRIPFVLFELPASLYNDVANYQVSLLNLESSDVNFVLKANYPFYTEQFDARIEASYYKQQGDQGNYGTSVTADVSGMQETKVGITQGRRYPLDAERPGFIHPSPDPLKVSMEKGSNLKQDIRALVNLTVAHFNTTVPDKQGEENSLESGLSFIGLVLQHGEAKIADYWADYENAAVAATVSYPKTYSIKTDADRQKDAKGIEELMDKIPANTYRKEMAKRIAWIMLNGKISESALQKIFNEIDEATTLNADPQTIVSDLQNGLCTTETASEARGYPKGEAKKAEKQHAERLALIAQSQGVVGAAQARGVNDLSGNPLEGQMEKAGKPGRGNGVDNKTDEEGSLD